MAAHSRTRTSTLSPLSSLSVSRAGTCRRTAIPGTIDYLLSNSSLISLRGGYFWDNYKDTNTLSQPQVRYNTTAENLPFTIPSSLIHQTNWYNVPLTAVTYFDITTRGFFQGDFSKTFEAAGTHNFKAGAGVQKITNQVNNNYQAGYNVAIYWNTAFKSLATGETGRGTYGYYRLRQSGTAGSTGFHHRSLLLSGSCGESTPV